MNIIKYLALICLFCFVNIAKSQDKKLENMLMEISKNSDIIGLGESTHGTKEFTEIKSEIVKILVTKYQFKNFVLEAGYIECLNMNNYIHGADIDSNMIFKGIPWPWTTKGFLSLLKWMKNYNENQIEEDKISIYGTDIGSMYAYRFYHEEIKFKTYVDPLLEIYKDTILSKNQKISLFEKQQKTFQNFENIQDSLWVMKCYHTLYCYTKGGGKARKYREEKLAESFLGIMKIAPKNAKFILWAHNQHVSKKSTHRKSMGYFLNQKLGKKYTNIAFDFYKGKFRAGDLEKPVNSDRMNLFEIDTLQNSISKWKQKDKTELTIVNLKTPQKSLPKRFYMHDVGAAYSEKIAQKNPKYFYEKVNRNRSFDYIIILPESTPSVYYREKF